MGGNASNASNTATSNPSDSVRGGGLFDRLGPTLLLALVTLGCLLLAIFDEPRFLDLMQEDGSAEWGTFFAFMLAGGLAIWKLASHKVAGLERLVFLGLAVFCLFVAGEEISWGQRIFGFRPPEVFLANNYQQETNLHNLLKDIFDSRWQVFLIASGYGWLLPLLARLWSSFPASFAPAKVVWPWLSAVALLELFYPFDLTGELAELLLGLTLLLDIAIRAPTTVDPGPGARVFLVSAGVVLLLSLGVMPALERVVRGSDPERVAEATSELNLLLADLAAPKALGPRIWRKRHIHKRLFTAQRVGYIHLGGGGFLEGMESPAAKKGTKLRRDRRGYFLDPWNQPYWLKSERKGDHRIEVSIYSFGPNRRRDFSEVAGGRGDDILVRTELLEAAGAAEQGLTKSLDPLSLARSTDGD